MATGKKFKRDLTYEINVSELINDPYSSVKHVRRAIHVALPPMYIGTEQKGVTDIFQDWLFQYVKSLNGVLLQYKQPMFVQPAGTIFHDQPYIHRDVTADFYIFQPHPGAILKGLVNKVSKKHVGCLVHGQINISLKTSDDLSLLDLVHVGQEILFEVESVETRHKTMRVLGKITDACLERMREEGMNFETEETNGYSAVDDNPILPIEDTDTVNLDVGSLDDTTSSKDGSKKKKKKKRRDEEHCYNSSEKEGLNGYSAADDILIHPASEDTNSKSSVIGSCDLTASSSKKKKKKHETQSRDYNSDSRNSDLLSLESEWYPKARKTHKRKKAKTQVPECDADFKSTGACLVDIPTDSTERRRKRKRDSHELEPETQMPSCAADCTPTNPKKKHKKHDKSHVSSFEENIT